MDNLLSEMGRWFYMKEYFCIPNPAWQNVWNWLSPDAPIWIDFSHLNYEFNWLKSENQMQNYYSASFKEDILNLVS